MPRRVRPHCRRLGTRKCPSDPPGVGLGLGSASWWSAAPPARVREPVPWVPAFRGRGLHGPLRVPLLPLSRKTPGPEGLGQLAPVAGTGAAPTARSDPGLPGGSCSPGRPWGAAEGRRQVRERLRGEWAGGLRGLFPGWKPPPPPSKSPGEAGRRRAWGRTRPRQCDFTRPPGLGFLGRADELWGLQGVSGGDWGGLSGRQKHPPPSKTHTQADTWRQKLPQVTQPARGVGWFG